MLSWACVLAKRVDAEDKMGDWSKEPWGTDEPQIGLGAIGMVAEYHWF